MTVRSPPVSREDAQAIASAWMARDGSFGVRGRVAEVLSYDEIRCREPIVYGFPPEVLGDFWVVYVDGGDVYALKSSTVVLVSKETGEVAYAGSANDEG